MSSNDLRRLIENRYLAIGELEFTQTTEGYRLYHRADRNRLSTVKVLRSVKEARELAKYDRQGAYRPLKGAPNLASGWVLELPSLEDLERALNYFYPAAIGAWRAYREKKASSVSLRETLERQTGMYRVAQKIGPQQAVELVNDFCRSEGHCLRTILWPIEPEQVAKFLPPTKSDPWFDQTGEGRKTIPYLCLEGCNLLVAAARKVVLSNQRKDSKK
jgi:sirohydrochlorin cobaltochelatase